MSLKRLSEFAVPLSERDSQSFQTKTGLRPCRNRKSKRREEVTVFWGLHLLVWVWSKAGQSGGCGKANLDSLKDVEQLDLSGRPVHRAGLIAERTSHSAIVACGPLIQMPTEEMEERPASAMVSLV